MSLNRYEQMLSDYIESHPEEKRYWLARVLDLGNSGIRREEAVLVLNSMLWEYFEERSRYEAPFSAVRAREGSEKVSMLNLAEYWLRMWAPPKVARKRS